MDTKTVSEQTLAAAFTARHQWYANRSSAIFPVRLRPGGNLIIAYLNYWAIKNRIDNVQRILRLYSSSGALAGRHVEKVMGTGATVSLVQTFSITDDFDGMLEIEFIALDNLRFPFPAIQGFYSDGRAFSSVHSAGRTKNPDEAQPVLASSIETNWICKFSETITPFFHVFSNGTASDTMKVEVAVLSPDKRVVASRTLANLFVGSFSSRLVAIDELFPELWNFGTQPPDNSYCRVTVPQSGIFPRLVVGNLHRATNFLEVTHSFAEQYGGDFVVLPPHVEIASFIPALKPNELDLELYSFPTNIPAKVNAAVRVQTADTSKLSRTTTKLSWQSGGDQAELMTYKLGNDDRFISLDLMGDRVPSRLNVSYRFSVRKSESKYSTDISTGAKSCVYPPKHSHWGSCIAGNGFRTVLMARNMSHNPTATVSSKGTLKIWWADGKSETRELDINSEASAFWTIDEPRADSSTHAIFFHWLANFDQPSIEMFWVSYADDGRICGDHSF